jgi:hypothetical protein
LSATATGVSTVQFLVDGLPVSPPLPSPFSTVWPSDSVPPGPHTITAVGQTSTGTVTSAPVAFITALAFAPDFRVTIASSPTVRRPGELLTAQLNVCNGGNLSGSTSVELLLSADAIISPRGVTPDISVGGAPVSLSVGECKLVTVSGPASPVPGAMGAAVFLGAIVDSAGSIAELDETNNTSPASPLLIGVGPDFTIPSLNAPTFVGPGTSFTTSIRVCNRGNQLGTTDVQLVSSTDTTIAGPPDIVIGRARISVAFGQCSDVRLQTALPSGTAFLGAVAVGVGLELVTTNNTSPARRIDVGTMADFSVINVGAPSRASPGTTFSFGARLCNNGTVAATTSGLVVLAPSRDFGAPPAPGVIPAGSFTVTLPAATCLTRSLTGTASPVPGATAAFVGVILDPTNAVPEFIETNNQLASPTAMVIGFTP